MAAVDRPGFIVIFCWSPSCSMRSGPWSAVPPQTAHLDRAMQLGCGHPMGRSRCSILLASTRWCALPTSCSMPTATTRYEAPALLRRMVDSGFMAEEREGVL